MTSLPLPLPPDDPRQVRALEAATELWCEGMHDTFSPRAKIIAGRALAAYFSALQTEGVRLVAAPTGGRQAREIVARARVVLVSGGCNIPNYSGSVTVSFEGDDWRDLADALNPDRDARPTKPCKACEGTGDAQAGPDELGPCPRCNGSGLARMVALDEAAREIAEWLREADGENCSSGPARRHADMIERRFLGTGEEPHEDWVAYPVSGQRPATGEDAP